MNINYDNEKEVFSKMAKKKAAKKRKRR